MYPQYDDLTDKQLVDVIHDKYYSNIPIKKFYAKVGLIKPHPPKNKEIQHTEKSNLTNQVVINPNIKATVEPKSNIPTDESIFLWVAVGLIIFFIFKKLLSVFKKPIPKRFAEHKRFDENTLVDLEEDLTDAEHIKYDTNKMSIFAEEYGLTGCIALLTILKDELKKTKAELAERTKLETERTVGAKKEAELLAALTKADRIKTAKRLSALEDELNHTKTELAERIRLKNKLSIQNQETVDPNKVAALEAALNETDRIKLKNKRQPIGLGDFKKETRLETDPPKLYENTSITKYKLGDIGPNGGKIFYINDKGNIGTEVKTADEDQRMNWFESVSKLGNNWRLPNKNELGLLYKQKNTIGHFRINAYWSSTEYNNQEAWVQFFNAGSKNTQRKDLKSNVRAVRSFHYSANNESPKYENLKYINPNPEKNSVMPIISTEKLAENLTRSSVSVIKDENTEKFEDMF